MRDRPLCYNEEKGAAVAINVQNESELHRQLKEYLCGSSYEMEKPVKGYVADLWSSDMIREIQTGNFPSLAAKLRALLPEYAVEVCFPVVERKTILVVDQDGALVSRRRPRKKAVPATCSPSSYT